MIRNWKSDNSGVRGQLSGVRVMLHKSQSIINGFNKVLALRLIIGLWHLSDLPYLDFYRRWRGQGPHPPSFSTKLITELDLISV